MKWFMRYYRECVENARGYDWDNTVNLTESFYLDTIQLR